MSDAAERISAERRRTPHPRGGHADGDSGALIAAIAAVQPPRSRLRRSGEFEAAAGQVRGVDLAGARRGGGGGRVRARLGAGAGDRAGGARITAGAGGKCAGRRDEYRGDQQPTRPPGCRGGRRTAQPARGRRHRTTAARRPRRDGLRGGGHTGDRARPDRHRHRPRDVARPHRRVQAAGRGQQAGDPRPRSAVGGQLAVGERRRGGLGRRVRIGPNVTIRQAGGGILVDNRPITSPYAIVALGPRMPCRMCSTAVPALQRLRLLEASYGVGVTVSRR